MKSVNEGSATFDQLLSVKQVEGMIADGHTIVILDQKVLKLDAWMKYHPGGHKPIQHMVGRDATDEVSVFHSKETRNQMARFQIGRIDKRWENFVPPIQGGQFRHRVGLDAKEQTEAAVSPVSLCILAEKEAKHRGYVSPTLQATAGSGSQDGLAFLDNLSKEEIVLTTDKYPALDKDIQHDITEKYRHLHSQIQAEGLYDCSYTAYAWELARCLLLFGLMLFFLQAGHYCISAIWLGWFWSQLVFAAHDAGHMAITQSFTIDTIIGMIIAAPIGGLSLGWWKRTHNVHHIVTNAPEHDPDNQHLPFFAVNHRFLGSLFSTYHERFMSYDAVGQFLVPYQAYLYYPVLMFGRFNLYVQSWIFLIQGQGPRKGAAWWHRWFEIAGNLVFWYWFGYLVVYKSIPTYWDRFAFVMVSHMVTMPLHVQFTLSHFAMSTADLGPTESFPQKMLRTTMDVDCPEWLDFFHGGLQFQAIHHLFPRIPRHNLRRTQKLVLQFCKEAGIPYALYGFVGGNKKVVGSLAEVGRQAAILANCQQSIAQRGDLIYGH
ncbi:fatty acid desaturase [Aspergillus alliaceus]|uniref:Delta 8-(E)-sphingolipid desaturase n=1 Tax=Petromyces alliaceus TaxID=209559 RepID=A0A5N7C1K9_PETAA|nr:fatty acid desaturase [Aspergillus alliaceus]